MPGQLSADKRRISYAEFKDVYEKIHKMAKALRLTETDIIRFATQEFVDKKFEEIEDARKNKRGNPDIRKLLRH
jgi:hypothetical protein